MYYKELVMNQAHMWMMGFYNITVHKANVELVDRAVSIATGHNGEKSSKEDMPQHTD